MATRQNIKNWREIKAAFIKVILQSDYQSEIEEQLHVAVKTPSQCLKDFSYDYRHAHSCPLMPTKGIPTLLQYRLGGLVVMLCWITGAHTLLSEKACGNRLPRKGSVCSAVTIKLSEWQMGKRAELRGKYH